MNISIKQWRNWHIVIIDGAFVVRELNDIRKEFEKIEKKPAARVALDFSDVSYIDSSALALIINFNKRLAPRNGSLVIFGPSEDILGVFSIANIEDCIAVYKTRMEFERACGGQ